MLQPGDVNYTVVCNLSAVVDVHVDLRRHGCSVCTYGKRMSIYAWLISFWLKLLSQYSSCDLFTICGIFVNSTH